MTPEQLELLRLRFRPGWYQINRTPPRYFSHINNLYGALSDHCAAFAETMMREDEGWNGYSFSFDSNGAHAVYRGDGDNPDYVDPPALSTEVGDP